MAGLILVGLLVLGGIILVVMLVTKQAKKRVRIFSGGYFIVIASFMFYTNHTCGPNAKDVEIMTPQAEAISDYILENGIPPNSLAEIPDLPYKFEGCKRTLAFKKYRMVGTYKEYYEDANKTNAQGEVLEETCRLEQNNRKCNVHIRFSASYKDDLNADENNQIIGTFGSNSFQGGKGELVFYNEVTETGLGYYYEFDMQQQKWEYDKYAGIKKYPHIYSTKNDGICNTLRQ